MVAGSLKSLEQGSVAGSVDGSVVAGSVVAGSAGEPCRTHAALMPHSPRWLGRARGPLLREGGAQAARSERRGLSRVSGSCGTGMARALDGFNTPMRRTGKRPRAAAGQALLLQQSRVGHRLELLVVAARLEAEDVGTAGHGHLARAAFPFERRQTAERSWEISLRSETDNYSPLTTCSPSPALS